MMNLLKNRAEPEGKPANAAAKCPAEVLARHLPFILQAADKRGRLPMAFFFSR
jgi:hypothetical protein